MIQAGQSWTQRRGGGWDLEIVLTTMRIAHTSPYGALQHSTASTMLNNEDGNHSVTAEAL